MDRTPTDTPASAEQKTKKRNNNRRRRNKQDVVLDFSGKRRGEAQAEVMSVKEFHKKERRKAKRPADQIRQRQFETTGQFFRRLDRLIASAKEEANLEARFDITLSKKTKGNNDEEGLQQDTDLSKTRTKRGKGKSGL